MQRGLKFHCYFASCTLYLDRRVPHLSHLQSVSTPSVPTYRIYTSTILNRGLRGPGAILHCDLRGYHVVKNVPKNHDLKKWLLISIEWSTSINWPKSSNSDLYNRSNDTIISSFNMVQKKHNKNTNTSNWTQTICQSENQNEQSAWINFTVEVATKTSNWESKL